MALTSDTMSVTFMGRSISGHELIQCPS